MVKEKGPMEIKLESFPSRLPNHAQSQNGKNTCTHAENIMKLQLFIGVSVDRCTVYTEYVNISSISLIYLGLKGKHLFLIQM